MSDLFPEERARRHFEDVTAEHEMTILHDEGVYRHVRFASPDSSTYLYDLITWPGNLVICGDVEAFHFARIRDMFDFFQGGGINPHYWSQKLQGIGGRRELAQMWSREQFVERIKEWLDDQCAWMEDGDDERIALLRQAVQDRLLDQDALDGRPWNESDAHTMIRDFDHDGIYVADGWEWDMREWRPQFLWACWAIVEGIKRYRVERPAEVSA